MKHTSDVPDIEVKMGGSSLPPELLAALIDVDVQDDVEGPSACRLSFLAWNEKKLDVSRVDDALFDMGNAVEIHLGYASRLEPVCKAEIVSVELELSSGQPPRFTVRAYDRSHRLRRGTQRRTFTNMKDSDIAAQIADQNGLAGRVEDSGLVHDHVSQNNRSDFDFLRERAADIDFEVVVDGTNLVFRAKRSTQTLRLAADKDLTELTAQAKAAEQVGAVEVRGWDPETKQVIVGTSSNGKAAPQGASGDAAFGAATLVIVDKAVSTQEAADRVAKAALERRARGSMSIEGSCLGRTDLRPGVEVELENAGARFGGKYRLTSVAHRFSGRAGFQTSFSGELVLT